MNDNPVRIGRAWIFPDGTTLPVVSGGSDTGPAAPPAGAAAPPSEAAPPPAPVTAGDPGAAPPPSPQPGTGETDWQQIAAQRAREAATWRTRVRAYEALPEEMRGSVHSLVDALARGDVNAAADWLYESGVNLAGDDFAARFAAASGGQLPNGQPAPNGQPPTPAPGGPQYLTPDDLVAILDERDQRHEFVQAVARQREAAVSELRDLGWEDPDHPLVAVLVRRARTEFGGDLKQADAAVRQEIMGLAGTWAQRQQAAAAAAGVPTPNGAPPGGADTRSPEEKMRDRVAAWSEGGNVQ